MHKIYHFSQYISFSSHIQCQTFERFYNTLKHLHLNVKWKCFKTFACKQNDFAKTKISNKDTYFDVSSVTVRYTFCQKPQNK